MLNHGGVRATSVALGDRDGNNDRMSSGMGMPHTWKSKSILRLDSEIVRRIDAPEVGQEIDT